MRRHFVAGAYYLRRLPLGGKLSPKVTDEGRSACPTGNRKPPLRRQLAPSFRGKVGYQIAPHPPQCAHWGTFPEGEGFGLRFPSRLRNHLPQPAQPVGGPSQA